MDISKCEVPELKAVAYDLMVAIERLRNDLMAVNQMIDRKSNQLIKPDIPEQKEELEEKPVE